MSTAQVESVLVEHNEVAEAAVVPVPHPVKVSNLKFLVLKLSAYIIKSVSGCDCDDSDT